MKKSVLGGLLMGLVLVGLVFVNVPAPVSAQILKSLQKKIEEKLEKKADEAVDQALELDANASTDGNKTAPAVSTPSVTPSAVRETPEQRWCRIQAERKAQDGGQFDYHLQQCLNKASSGGPDEIAWRKAQTKLLAQGKPLNSQNMMSVLDSQLATRLKADGDEFLNGCQFNNIFAKYHDCACLAPQWRDSRSALPTYKLGYSEKREVLAGVKNSCYTKPSQKSFTYDQCMAGELGKNSKFCQCMSEKFADRYEAQFVRTGKWRDVDTRKTQPISIASRVACSKYK